jgi:hypothetical protein
LLSRGSVVLFLRQFVVLIDLGAGCDDCWRTLSARYTYAAPESDRGMEGVDLSAWSSCLGINDKDDSISPFMLYVSKIDFLGPD